MPGLVASSGGVKLKRKRGDEHATKKSSSKPRKAQRLSTDNDNSEDAEVEILALESQVTESREHYNNIVKLQNYVDAFSAKKKNHDATLAAVALCRVFCRLIAAEKLVKRSKDSEADAQVVQWLKARLRDYVASLCLWIGSPDASTENTALTLLMRVVKEETSQEPKRSEQAWQTEKSAFASLVRRLIEETDAEGARQEFVDNFVEEHDDVRFFTFLVVKDVFNGPSAKDEVLVSNGLDLLQRVEGVPESEDQLEDWYGQEPQPETHRLRTLAAHRKAAQECWLAIFRSQLNDSHRKKIMSIMTAQILPWFPNRMEILADFLTDSFNAGGSLSLLALSGIFQLMTQQNLDYPEFYTKLYSLLDDEILHSKHRSRFFRLLAQFMASTHLPAALVASFIKRLARLALQAPPGAIVWLVPWTYNLMREHPSCTFMLHRTYHPAHSIYTNNPKYEEQGMDDPFDMAERDPMKTSAIHSSLWELHTLQDHWHPNVATLARILGEQFTKRDYQLEDFLDHTYATLLEGELGREVKKKPEVEWEIPKRIVTDEEGGLNALGRLLESAIQTA